MKRALTPVTLCLAVVVVAALRPLPAGAEPGPIQLVSKNAVEQADFAERPALAADGRYVAFRGSIGAQQGIFRKDLQSGAVMPVVAASAYAEPAPPETGSGEPSISADGRYVSFTTTASLDPAADDPPPPATAPQDSDVYVADMSTSPPTYELASALDGSSTGLTYGGNAGSKATGRVSLSADGRRVVFVTEASSNLTGDPHEVGTPAGQVALRDLAAKTTTLVSANRDPSTGTMEPGVPVAGGAVASNTAVRPGASLSADGATVAWLGTNLGDQVPLLADESLAASGGYDEPLWRRVPTVVDPAPPTRRIVGGGDPLAPGCPPGGTLADPACRGPFPGIATGANTKGVDETCLTPSVSGWDTDRVTADFVPQLSADGRTVALLGEPDGFANVFLVDMSAGLTRVQAVRQLTREVPTKEDNACLALSNLAGAGDITGTAISPGGDRVAFTTQRQQFPLAPPNLIGSPPAAMGLAELYLVDLDGGTLQRLTHGATPGEPSKRLEEAGNKTNAAIGASSVSFDAGGGTLAFSSRASNLVAGDGNGESVSTGSAGSDVFLVTDPRSPTIPGAASASAAPPPIEPRVRRRLTASAASRPDGSVRLAVAVPGPRRLRVRARAAVGVDGATRTVAGAGRRTHGDTVVVISLDPAARYRRLVHSQAGLEATLEVRFAGPGGKPLKDALDVRFRTHGGNGATASEGGGR